MANKPFEYHPDAISEAAEAYRRYAERSPEVADRFWDELVQARGSVCAAPASWTPYFHGTRCFPLRKFPYGLVYVEREAKIIGLAVCHFHRKPGYWRARLGGTE